MSRALPFLALLVASPALADPCEARVTGYQAGATVAGAIRYVGDADSLCIGPGTDPKTWTEIRLADFFGPELDAPGGRAAAGSLTRMVIGKRAVCTATRGRSGRTVSYDRLFAVCRIDGTSVGDMMRRAGVPEGGNGR